MTEQLSASPLEFSTDPINDGQSPYMRFVADQGVPVFRGFYIEDVGTLPLGAWSRRGANASFVHLQGAEEVNNAYVCEIAPGGSTIPDRHVFEEILYIASGTGATTIRNSAGDETTFEWRKGSLFSIPLNTTFQHFNGSGSEPARYYAVTSAPLMMNLIHNYGFIFNNDYDFSDRFGASSDYSGAGEGFAERVWDTNFIADVATMPLQSWDARGKGSSNVMIELANSSLCAHISAFPVGQYKKAHRHPAGAHVIILAGEGYSLLWQEGQPIQRVDWRPGSVVAPPDGWFHQHFNLSHEPARYLAIRWGSAKNKVFDMGGYEKSVKLGGNQIETEDEAPEIRQMFVDDLRARGITTGLGSGS